jgi:hypothetical protein
VYARIYREQRLAELRAGEVDSALVEDATRDGIDGHDGADGADRSDGGAQ